MASPDGSESDVALVTQAEAGDPVAVEALVRRHYRAAFSLAFAIMGNRADAEDVTHDALVTALQRLADCRNRERFVGWLLRIVRNKAFNARDYRRVRAAAPLEHDSAASSFDSAHELERGELRSILERALMELTETQRTIVLLYDLDGRSHREIALALGISEGMSRQHLFVARGLLRARLGRDTLKEYIHDR
jgi:RNA polymerase sigma-70 factor (ECF subfamily)